MILSQLKILRSHGRQSIKDLSRAEVPAPFRGRPEITAVDAGLARDIETVCPSGAFRAEPLSIDLGRCAFCGECAAMSRGGIRFTADHRMASNVRENLVVRPGMREIVFDRDVVRDEICSRYRRALRLREVSAGGDNSTEMELNASMNVNFDFGRYGVEFTASPRHADGLVVSGPVTANMHTALDICYCSVAEPKIVVARGYDNLGRYIQRQSGSRKVVLRQRTHRPLPARKSGAPPDLYRRGDETSPAKMVGLRLERGPEFESARR